MKPASQEGGGVSAEELNRLGRHLRDVTDRIEIGTNPGPANASRDMNYDEKRKLSIFMGELDGDKLEKVIEIISQDQEDGLPGESVTIPDLVHIAVTVSLCPGCWSLQELPTSGMNPVLLSLAYLEDLYTLTLGIRNADSGHVASGCSRAFVSAAMQGSLVSVLRSLDLIPAQFQHESLCNSSTCVDFDMICVAPVKRPLSGW